MKWIVENKDCIAKDVAIVLGFTVVLIIIKLILGECYDIR